MSDDQTPSTVADFMRHMKNNAVREERAYPTRLRVGTTFETDGGIITIQKIVLEETSSGRFEPTIIYTLKDKSGEHAPLENVPSDVLTMVEFMKTECIRIIHE